MIIQAKNHHPLIIKMMTQSYFAAKHIRWSIEMSKPKKRTRAASLIERRIKQFNESTGLGVIHLFAKDYDNLAEFYDASKKKCFVCFGGITVVRTSE